MKILGANWNRDRIGGQPVDSVEKAPRRRLRARLVQDGERTYAAYSANELIEIESLTRNSYRPGMPY